MSTKYYTVEPTNAHHASQFMWLIVVEDDIIVWSQALAPTTGRWYTGIYQDYKLSEVFYGADLVEF
jgi:hypothetical protein